MSTGSDLLPAVQALLPADRVRHPLFGCGTVVDAESFAAIGLILVRWDTPPPWDYNCGQNPAVAIGAELERLAPERPPAEE